MKTPFLSLALFVFINANSQMNVGDSLDIEMIRETNESMFGNMVGKALPLFTAKDLNGKIYTNSTITNGKTTFINLWFISCAPCIAEIPNLNRLYDMMKDSSGFQFFAITRESEAQVKEAVSKYGIRFPILLTSSEEAQELVFKRGYPTSMVLDGKGNVRAILSGGLSKPGPALEAYWKQEIEKLRRQSYASTKK